MNELAPCIAIVGPPNSGKTTFLHLLDLALRKHPSKPLAYVVKGHPDGTGRYLLYSPGERELVKARVKGKWNGAATIDQIRTWTRASRRWLEISLLDFGGKHSPENHSMLSECSHYIVLSRTTFDSEAQREAEGPASWQRECQAAGLQELAVIDSQWKEGSVGIDASDTLPIRASFRADHAEPEANPNDPVIGVILSAILKIPQPGRIPPYINLARIARWSTTDTLAQFQETLGAEVERFARSSSPVLLGGATGVFVYLIAVAHALRANRETAIELFDPKLPQGFVGIPPSLQEKVHEDFPYSDLALSWIPERAGSLDDCAVLDIRLIGKDKFLPPEAAALLEFAPLPTEAGRVTGREVKLHGGMPTWLWAAYLRWLIESGVKRVWFWDMGSRQYIQVHPHT